MVKSIQFRQGSLHLVIAGAVTGGSRERECSIKFDFGECGAVSKLHRSELMNFLYAIDTEDTYQIGNLIFELLGTQTRVCRIDFHRLDSPGKSLEGGAAPDVGIQLAGSAVERAGSEEDIPF